MCTIPQGTEGLKSKFEQLTLMYRDLLLLGIRDYQKYAVQEAANVGQSRFWVFEKKKKTKKSRCNLVHRKSIYFHPLKGSDTHGNQTWQFRFQKSLYKCSNLQNYGGKVNLSRFWVTSQYFKFYNSISYMTTDMAKVWSHYSSKMVLILRYQ